MMVLLLWLTVSSPVIYEVQQDVATQHGLVDDADASGPFSGTTEENVEAGSNALSEYLHDVHAFQPSYALVVPIYKVKHDIPYPAFHPEQVSPPPEPQA